MAKKFFENLTKAPVTQHGVMLAPGEGKWIEVPPATASPASPATVMYGAGSNSLLANDREIYPAVGTAVVSGLAAQSHGGQGAPSSSGGGKANTMWQETMWLPCGVDAVRIRIPQNVVDVSTYGGVLVGVQTTDGSGAGADWLNPYMGGAVQAMQRATWNGANNPTFTNAPDVNTPVGPWSDWIPVNNTGMGGPSALIVRTWYPAAVAAGGGWVAVNILGGRTAALTALGVASFIGTKGSDETLNNATNPSPAGGSLVTQIQFATRKRVKSMLDVGDSNDQGYYRTGCLSPFEAYCIAQSRAGNPVAFAGRGASGQTSAQYFNRLAQDIAAGEKPDVIGYRVFSVNDAKSQASLQAAINRTYAVLRIADSLGVPVILKDCLPMNAGTPNANELLVLNGVRTFLQDLKGMRPGILVLTYEGLHDPAQYGKWVAAYNYNGDGYHHNEASGAVVDPAVAAIMTKALGLVT